MTTLGVRRRILGATDAHGNPIISYADPTDWPVWGLAPGAQTENPADNRDLSVIAWTVYAPVSDAAPTELDRVVVDGDEYDVNARPADWTRGLWPHPTAGLVVELRRTEG